MDTNEAQLRASLGAFYGSICSTVRAAADLVKVPNTDRAALLRQSLVRTLGSVDRLSAALEPQRTS